MGPKREPKTTPRRSKIDIKIDQKNESKTKRAVPVLTCRLWAGTPPRELPGGAPGAQGRGPRHLYSHRLSKKEHNYIRILEFWNSRTLEP